MGQTGAACFAATTAGHVTLGSRESPGRSPSQTPLLRLTRQQGRLPRLLRLEAEADPRQPEHVAGGWFAAPCLKPGSDPGFSSGSWTLRPLGPCRSDPQHGTAEEAGDNCFCCPCEKRSPYGCRRRDCPTFQTPVQHSLLQPPGSIGRTWPCRATARQSGGGAPTQPGHPGSRDRPP